LKNQPIFDFEVFSSSEYFFKNISPLPVFQNFSNQES